MKKLSRSARFKLVVEELYANNLAKAAAALGLDRSTVSRYVGGRNPPLCALMLASRLHDIDLDWLTDGTELKLRYAKSHYSGEAGRPVSDVPCVGVPDHTTPKFRGEFRQVAPFHNVPDRYWLRLATDIPALKLFARDYILMQAIPARQVTHGDVDCLRVLKRGDVLEVGIPSKADVKSEVQVLAAAHLAERDLF